MKTNLLMPALGGMIEGFCIAIALYLKQRIPPDSSYSIFPIAIALVGAYVTVIHMTFGKDYSNLNSNLFATVDKEIVMRILKANLRLLVFGAFLFSTLGLLKVMTL
jgi:hypothetical protein